MKKFLLLFLFIGIMVSASTAQDMRVYMKKDSVAKFPIANIDSISFAPCLSDSFFVNGIYPNPDCITIEARPPFSWDVQSPNREFGKLTYDVTLVEMSTKDTSLTAFNSKKPLFVLKEIKEKSVAFPTTLAKLMMGKIYAWRVRTYENNKLVAVSEVKPFYIIDYQMPFDMRDVLCCLKNLVVNGTMQSGNTSGVLGAGGRIDNWQKGYGSPVVKSDTDGCNSPGYVQLQGNKFTGSCIKQTLQPGNRILQGKHYRFSACVRLRQVQKSSDYALLKAVAYNSSLPGTGTHPQPSSNLAIIGWTGKLTLNEWATTSVRVWSPNQNFDNIAVYCYTNSGDTTAYCDIDNICLVETTDSIPCDDYVYDGNGNPIIDTSIMNQARDTTYTYYDEYMGLTSDLYSSQGNTSLDTWYSNNDSCASTGGFVPLNIQNMNYDDSLAAWGYPGTGKDIDSILSITFSDTTEKMRLFPIPPFTKKCNTPFVVNNDMPFGGRDIVFVHGLKLDQLCDRNELVQGALTNWPINPNQFKGTGYYKKMAEEGWADHIQTWLKSRGYTNRFLIVAYNCSQPLLVATHAVLSQIQNAMETGEGVVNLDPRDPRKKECFGQSLVLVSHSTGGLVSDVSMSIAEKSKTDPAFQLTFGNVGYIADRVKAHVAFHPVLAGSKMASLFLALQIQPNLISTVLNMGVCDNLKGASPAMRVITQSSILLDLQPSVVSTLWRPFINSSPVPTITIAGGHPYGVDNAGETKWAIHPGLDDGVSTMSSQSGNPNFETGYAPSGYFRTWNPFKVYDMGIPTTRANSYYLDQTLFTGPGFVASGSVNHLSATGMVQPIGSVPALQNCENRYNNHYSFLQTASDHYIGPRGKSAKDGFDLNNYSATTGFTPPTYDYDPSFGGMRNYEESRAVTNTDIYTRGLVSSSVANMQQERIRGRYLTITIPLPHVRFLPSFRLWWEPYYIIIPIWERTYHNMVGFESECECSYVYKYVLRP